MIQIARRLEELSICFQPYSVLWPEWESYKGNGLTKIDIYTLNVLLEKQFQLDINDLVMFYYRNDVINRLIKKLEEYKIDFYHWQLKQWQYTLCELAIETGFESFFVSDITKINLHPNLKCILLEFEQKTIREIMKDCSSENVFLANHLDKIQSFLTHHRSLVLYPIKKRKEVKRHFIQH